MAQIILCKDETEAEMLYDLLIRIGFSATIICCNGYYNSVEFW